APVKAGADVQDAVRIHRFGNNRIAFVIDLPNEGTIAWIYGDHTIAARSDHLRLTVDIDLCGGTERELLGGVDRPRAFPSDRSIGGFQGGDVRICRAVACEDQPLIDKDRRTAAAV